ncbi:MAG: carboxypeptidase-like regulatory domain-containing protein, partial [Verrucomicrobiota bacterium]|nr:carboxypeptidase-like regulatory domain-containing protein [Verrucomicrobiota bacterium]
EYDVGFSAQAGLGFAGLLNTTLRATGNWSWTNSDTRSGSSGTISSATVTVGGPAFGYQGPTEMAVYYDVLYRTFLITPLPSAPPSLSGVVNLTSGKPARGKEVLVVAKGRKYRTFTNAKGEYRIHGNLSGPIQLQVGRVTKHLPQLPANRIAEAIVLK